MSYQKYIDEVSEKRAAYEESFENFPSMVRSLFDEFPALDTIIIRGSTPGFNDGDVCLHSQENFIEFDALHEIYQEDYYDEDEDDGMGMSEPEDQSEFNFNIGDMKVHSTLNKDLSAEDAAKVDSALYYFEDYLVKHHETDFEILLIRDEKEGYVKHVGHYDCGY